MIGTTLSSRYRLEAKLGSGGMSTVYLARDETLDRLVAVKVMHAEMSEQPDQLTRFNQEARSVAQLSHPNVVGVIDAGEDSGHPYIVLEYVEGETLKQRIKRLGQLPVDDAVAYAIEVARALAIAHARRMVHRDVKPQNVLIDADGRGKLTDFGISRQLEQQGITATGRVLGTTDYVSPEQAMGHAVDPRSDIYSLGVVLFEMLTGDVPFHADSLVGVAMKHVNEDLPDVQRRRPEVSAAVAAVLERATTKDPRDRYQSAGEMLDDLEAALEVEAARAGETTGEATSVLEALPPSRRRLTRQRASWAGIGVLLLAGAVAIALVALISGGNVGGGGGGIAEGEPISIDSANDFDPEGDLAEDPDRVRLAIDGNPTGTAWVTDHYDTEDWGGIKTGVGLYVTTGRPVEPSQIEVYTPNQGWAAEVYAAATSPPEDLSGWGPPIGDAAATEDRTTITLEPDKPARYFLLWFTRPAEARDQPGRYQVEVSDIRLLGA
jgi:serine/threonine-protein kinase